MAASASPATASAYSLPPRDYSHNIQSDERVLLLGVPFRSQFDGSLWQNANCGPTSLAMVLAAYGSFVPTQQLRDLANHIQGTSGYRDGTSLSTLQTIARTAGLQASGLYASGGGYARWTTDDVRSAVSKGWPVITLVRYRSLRWNSWSSSQSLHYIVVVGFSRSGFFVHDPGTSGNVGKYQWVSFGDLQQAWSDAGAIGNAVAIGPGAGQLPVPTAWLVGAELVGSQNVAAFGPSGSLTNAVPLVTQAPAAANAAGSQPQAPLPPDLAGAEQPESNHQTGTRSESPQVRAPGAAQTVDDAIRSVVKSRLAAALAGRWSRAATDPTPTDMWVAPPEVRADDGAMTGATTIVLATATDSRTDHRLALGIVACGVVAAALILRLRVKA